jgi:hypothetical protein
LNNYQSYHPKENLLTPEINDELIPKEKSTLSVDFNHTDERETILTTEDQHLLTNRDHRKSVHDNNALREDDTESIYDERLKSITVLYQEILSSIGENSCREG